MVTHVKNTKNKELKGVYFEDVDALVSSKDQAWLVSGFYFKYYSTEEAAKASKNIRQG